ncbi:MAG: PEP-CTERM sorting domain-containing protein [Pirellulaceae bacterium]
MSGETNSSNKLQFTPPAGWTADTSFSGTVQYYYYSPPGSGGVNPASSAGTITYDMAVLAATPSDYYTLTFQTAGGLEDWSESDAFVLHVVDAVPEPSTFLLMGFGVVGLLVWRRRKNAK